MSGPRERNDFAHGIEATEIDPLPLRFAREVPSAPAIVPAPPAPTASSDSVGGRYRIVERIGEGGMGLVYKVVHSELNKTFALKVIMPSAATNNKDGRDDTPQLRQQFFREARMASSLRHPNIVDVVDFGEDTALGSFMVMEFVDGKPLVNALHEEGKLAPRVACEIAYQVAEALNYIHQNDIIHCDIKTENILLTEQTTGPRRQRVVKLLDFGLARRRSSDDDRTLSGTPHYVAPERIRGGAASPASDVYSLGILFYEMLTGIVPWDGETPFILNGHLEKTPQPPSELVDGGLDPALDRLVMHSLAKTPAERHKDMAAFLYELSAVMDMLGFGRRRSAKPRRPSSNIASTMASRDSLARVAFDACRLPLALVDAAGAVLVGNDAFARFVGATGSLEGQDLAETALIGAWPHFPSELAMALMGTSARRVISVENDVGATRRLLLWIDAAGTDRAVVGVQPLDS